MRFLCPSLYNVHYVETDFIFVKTGRQNQVYGRQSGILPENLEVFQKIWKALKKKSEKLQINCIVSI
jgi:hypothetical protein